MKDYSISMDQDDIARWKGPLIQYYVKSKGLSEKDAKIAISQVLDEVKAGWNRAPKDIDTRIKMKTGFQWVSQENLNVKKLQIKKVPVGKEVPTSSGSESFLYDNLDDEEKLWWDRRKDEYNHDFIFNESSDKPLLVQLLFEELMQKRLFLKQLDSDEQVYGKLLTESLKRVTELQIKLGITREQREGALDNIDGNVAEISISLDKKLDTMPKQMKLDYDEEFRYTALKNQRPPINILPAKETMMAIINRSSMNDKFEITNKVAQEITDEVYKNRIDKKPEIVELPDGEVI